MAKIISVSFGENFILKVADYLEENFIKKNIPLDKLAVVFGGKRPELFLKRELAKRIKNSFFSPSFFSIDEFVEEIVSRKEKFSRISDLDACFIIYSLAKEISPELIEGRKEFSKFLPWSKEILSFIEHLDMEDVSNESLKNIQANAKIGYDVPENINVLLQNITVIRDEYHKILKKDKTYSRGFLYLLASKLIADIDFSEFDAIIFCNFFYLHKTEENIIKNLYKRDKIRLIFQGDEDDWKVLQKISESFSCRIKPSNIKEPDYKLSICRGFDTHSQVGITREILKEIKNLENTVIVLPEPDSLIPLLSEISSFAKDFNVSLGYPVKRSSLYSLFESIFHAQLTKKDDNYYVKDYLKVLSHPFIKNLKVIFEPSVTRILIHKIEDILINFEETELGGSLFVKLNNIQELHSLYELTKNLLSTMEIEVSFKELEDVLKEIHVFSFTIWDGINSFLEFAESIEKLIDKLLENSFMKNHPVNLKITQRIFSITDELKNVKFSKEKFPKEEIFKIFMDKLENEMISFSGSPLKGLQILGLLETRSLNFDNVIVMDVNESILPKLRIYEPLIPREVMLNLGLNRLEREEEMQRYQFMRLISSAKNVYLIYEENKNYERSRFIEELIWKKEQETGSLDAIQILLAGFSIKVLPQKGNVKKNNKIIKFLESREYSASSINTYLHCPLRFYYQYILGLEEKEDLFEEPEGIHIGRFLHTLLEKSFEMFVGKKPVIDENFRNYFFDMFEKEFKEFFEKRMKSDSFMLKQILEVRLNQFLEKEETRDEVEKIICVEKKFKEIIDISGKKFNFICIVDRIDKLVGGNLLIIDYKTGSDEPIPKASSKLRDIELSARTSIKQAIHSFQLPLYLHCIGKQFKDNEVISALYNLRTLELKYFPGRRDIENKENIMSLSMDALKFILQEILNPDIEFTADDEDVHSCQNCPFFYLCR